MIERQEIESIIRECVHMMVKFHIENRTRALYDINRQSVDKWLDEKFKKEKEEKNADSLS